MREKMLAGFVKWSVVKAVVCVAAGVVAGFLMGGGDTVGIETPWEFAVAVLRCDKSKMPAGMFVAFAGWLIWMAYGYMEYERKKNSRIGEEYGGSKLLTKREMPRFNQLFFYDPKICGGKTYYDKGELKRVCRRRHHTKEDFLKCFEKAQILGQDVYLSMNSKFVNRNLNTITIGGSGQGKSYSELFPNGLNANANYVFTDPSGEILQKIGRFLKMQGYKIRVFNVDDFAQSMKYNPIAYVKSEKDYNVLVDALVDNINMGQKTHGNEFFEKGAKSLECALIALLKELYPHEPEKQTFSNVMQLLRMARQEEDEDSRARSTLDGIFEFLKEENPSSYACKMWENFRVGGEKVCNEIIISSAADLGRYFDNQDIAWLTSTDELCLEELAGEEKVALFLIIPQATKSYNFLVSMIYSQLFDIVTKAGKAWRDEHGLDDPRLPRHLSLWLDEFSNCGKIPNFLELLSVVRKYNISINIIVQGMAQLKGMYPKEEWEVILANLDTMIYLGGMEPSTVKWLSEKLGKETIRTFSYNRGKGRGESYQSTGRSLMTADEIEQMSRSKELIFISGCKPIQTGKYDLKKHPNYKYCGEADSANNLRLGEVLEGEALRVDREMLDKQTVTEKEIREFLEEMDYGVEDDGWEEVFEEDVREEEIFEDDMEEDEKEVNAGDGV